VKKIPPRIHVLLAPKAKVGVVIRRGPSKTVCTLLWNLRTDEFTLGQWMRGRIYERRCDLSPDGKHMVYFAMNGRWDSAARGSWTAISRVPYLKALALYPKGDCWFGGGLFLGNHTFWINGGISDLLDPTVPSGNLRVDRLHKPKPSYGGECPGVYYHRLQRDGWKYVEHQEIDKDSAFDVFDKELTYGWILRKIAHSTLKKEEGKAVYRDAHELLRLTSGNRLQFSDWEWADYESNRLLWSAGGKIFSAKLKSAGVMDRIELHDFNDMHFKPVKAPY